MVVGAVGDVDSGADDADEDEDVVLLATVDEEEEEGLILFKATNYCQSLTVD